MNARTVAISQIIRELFPFLFFAVCPKRISESINGNQMKLDTLREGDEKKSNVQEPKPFYK